MHWPGIEPGSPAWEARILPLNHQCQYIKHICKDSQMEFYSGLSQVAGHSYPVLVDGLGFHPQPSAVPAALCPLASCGLLWRALRCALDPSEWWNRLLLVLTGPVLSKTLCDPLSTRLLCPWDCHAPLLENPSRQYSCPLGSCLAPCALQGA